MYTPTSATAPQDCTCSPARSPAPSQSTFRTPWCPWGSFLCALLNIRTGFKSRRLSAQPNFSLRICRTLGTPSRLYARVRSNADDPLTRRPGRCLLRFRGSTAEACWSRVDRWGIDRELEETRSNQDAGFILTPPERCQSRRRRRGLGRGCRLVPLIFEFIRKMWFKWKMLRGAFLIGIWKGLCYGLFARLRVFIGVLSNDCREFYRIWIWYYSFSAMVLVWSHAAD